MPTASNMPMPMSGAQGLASGFDMGNRLMQQIIQRQQQAQEMELKKQQEARLAEQFNKSFGLQSAAAGRAAQLFPLQLQQLRQKIEAERMANDPQAQIAYLQQLQAGMGGMMGGVSSEAPPAALTGGYTVPQTGEPFTTTPQPQTQAGGLPPEFMQRFIGAQYKRRFGFDPFEQPTLTGDAAEIQSLENLGRMYGKDSQAYQDARKAWESKVSQREDLARLRGRQFSGLKPGEKEFYDPQSGQPLGREIPLTATERQSEEGASLFNELYPYVYKGASPFSGEGSIQRLEMAARNYKNDPKARQLFDDFLLSQKMMAATMVNEASTLKAGKTNRTYQILKESLEAQDIPKKISKLIKEYQIPASAQLKAGIRYQEILSEARKKARASIPATQRLYYDPERQAAEEAAKLESEPTRSDQPMYKDSDLVNVQTADGVKVMTYAEAKALGAQ